MMDLLGIIAGAIIAVDVMAIVWMMVEDYRRGRRPPRP